MPGQIRILGAGLSGLSCAINLAQKKIDVEVVERCGGVGAHIKPNQQRLRYAGENAGDYFNCLNLNPEGYESRVIPNFYLATRYRLLDVKTAHPALLVTRGGEKSLEYALYRQAIKLGVKFKFNHEKPAKLDVNATGAASGEISGAAYGETYAGADFPADHGFVMYDDRYSPRGWYLYITPHGEDEVEVINCVSQPHSKNVKKLYQKALREQPFIKKTLRGAEKTGSIAGVGHIGLPKKATVDGVLHVGEAAGFQDATRGYGMNYALESGKLAADCILGGRDYEKLWRQMFLPRMKRDFAKRFVTSIMGDRIIRFMLRRYRDADTIDFTSFNPQENFIGKLLTETFYRLEVVKKKATGYW
ncbi:MAG: NAD(P)-binding protein [Candidatus Altiarchaeales archaeon]|nr:NAD(P)-binding protein [Candidatus Altiarchaeales archaeon]